MYTQNQFNHVLNTLFEPFDEASSITIRYTSKPQTDTQEPPSYKITDVNGFKTPQAYGEHLAFLHSALVEQLEPAIVRLSIADRGHFFMRAQERCSKLLAEIHEELPSPEVLRCGKPFRVIRVFNRPVFQPAGDIRPGDALAIKLSRLAHAWAWQWWLSLSGLQDVLKRSPVLGTFFHHLCHTYLYHVSVSFFIISKALSSIFEKANHFLPRSFNEAPK